MCRDCGLALFRRQQNRTLLTGWWGLLFAPLANVWAVVANMRNRSTVEGLMAPTGAPQAPPLPAGRPLFQRAGVYVGALFLLVVSFFVFGRSDQSADSFADSCVRFDAAHTKVVKTHSCGDSHDGKVIGVVSSDPECPSGTDGSFRLKAEDERLLCVDLDQ